MLKEPLKDKLDYGILEEKDKKRLYEIFKEELERVTLDKKALGKELNERDINYINAIVLKRFLEEKDLDKEIKEE